MLPFSPALGHAPSVARQADEDGPDLFHRLYAQHALRLEKARQREVEVKLEREERVSHAPFCPSIKQWEHSGKPTIGILTKTT